MKQSIKLAKSKKISLVVCDCDGTILDEQKRIDPELRETVQALQERGISFTLASGRNYFLMRPIVEELSVTLPYITDNGGNLYQGDHRLINNILPAEELSFIASWLFLHRLPFLLYTDMTVYTYAMTSSLERFIQRLEGLMKNCAYQEDQTFDQKTCYKITVDSTGIIEMDQYAEEFHKEFPDVNIHPSEGKLYTITSLSATKGNALMQLAESLKIPLEEIMVFGDNHNDISMLEEAGWGVAVANAEKDVQEAADDICGSSEEAGVSQYLIQYLDQ